MEPQVTSRPPGFQRKHGTCPCVGSDMLKDDIDPPLLRQLTDNAFEAVDAVVDDMVGAQRLGFLDLFVRSNRRDHGAAHALGELDRRSCRYPIHQGMDKDRFTGLQLCIVEKHVLDGAEGDRRDGRADGIDAGRGRDEQTGRSA